MLKASSCFHYFSHLGNGQLAYFASYTHLICVYIASAKYGLSVCSRLQNTLLCSTCCSYIVDIHIRRFLWTTRHADECSLNLLPCKSFPSPVWGGRKCKCLFIHLHCTRSSSALRHQSIASDSVRPRLSRRLVIYLLASCRTVIRCTTSPLNFHQQSRHLKSNLATDCRQGVQS